MLFYWEAHARAVITIADLLERDFSVPIEEFVQIKNDDPDTVFTELTEYVATDRLKAEYEGLLSVMAAASKIAQRRGWSLDFRLLRLRQVFLREKHRMRPGEP